MYQGIFNGMIVNYEFFRRNLFSIKIIFVSLNVIFIFHIS